MNHFHKCQHPPVPYPAILQLDQKCAQLCSEWSIVGNTSLLLILQVGPIDSIVMYREGGYDGIFQFLYTVWSEWKYP